MDDKEAKAFNRTKIACRECRKNKRKVDDILISPLVVAQLRKDRELTIRIV
jgi:hypothetical protein